MATTTFTDGVTPVVAEWLNEVNTSVFTTVPNDVAALAAHIADTTDAHDASAISIVDAGGYYTSTDVEGALQEVSTSTSYGYFVPTLTVGANTNSVSNAGCHYSKVGKHITISGILSLIPIATGQTNFTMTVPFPFTDALESHYTVSGVVGGIGFDTSGALYNSTSSGGSTILVRAFVTNAAMQLITFTGSYIAD